MKEAKYDFYCLIVGNSLSNRGHAIFFNPLDLIEAEIWVLFLRIKHDTSVSLIMETLLYDIPTVRLAALLEFFFFVLKWHLCLNCSNMGGQYD